MVYSAQLDRYMNRYMLQVQTFLIENHRGLNVLYEAISKFKLWHIKFGLQVIQIYTQRQKLSTTSFVAKFFRARICGVNKPYK